MRVLVVEDEPTMLSALSDALTHERLAVDIAPDGREALSRVHIEQSYDLIAQPATIKGQSVVVATFEGLSAEALRSAGDMAEQQLGNGVFIGMVTGGDGFTVIKVFGAASATFSARAIFRALTDKYGGKGGGNDRMCQGRIAGLPTAEELEALLG